MNSVELPTIEFVYLHILHIMLTNFDRPYFSEGPIMRDLIYIKVHQGPSLTDTSDH